MATELTSPAFWVLAALAERRRHGYEIIEATVLASEGRTRLKVTTLYAVLERLERQHLVAEDGEEIVNGRARRYYRVTDHGIDALDHATAARENQARIARQRLAARAVSARPQASTPPITSVPRTAPL